MSFEMKHRRPSAVSVAFTTAIVLTVLCLSFPLSFGKPVDDTIYKDTEEIMNEWDNDDSYYNYNDEPQKSEEPENMSYLPPTLVQYISTTAKPIYFPRTDIELGPLLDQVTKARRKEIVGPVDLPVPYIVWTKDSNGKEDRVNYWQRFYNTMYKVD